MSEEMTHQLAAAAERLANAAETLDRVLGKLDAQQQALNDTVANESESYLDDESEKKASGKTYVDIEHARPMYLPTMKEGKWTVLAKLQAAEYAPSKTGEGKGRPTGKQKVLVFNYRLDGSKWTEVEPPKWEDVDANAAAAAHK